MQSLHGVTEGGRTMGRGLAVGGIMLMVALTFPAAAKGANCGQGVSVCRCGDTVVADITLTSSLRDCPGVGLAVAGGVRLDLGGNEISGRGTAVGIELRGDGSTITNGMVTGFEIGVGVSARSPSPVNRTTVEFLTVQRNTDAGIFLTGSFNTVSDNEAIDNGVSPGGLSRAGIFLAGNSNVVARNDSGQNGLFGILVGGRQNVINERNQVYSNGRGGIGATGSENLVENNDVGDVDFGNGCLGILVERTRSADTGPGNTVRGNDVNGNGGRSGFCVVSGPGGIFARGSGHVIVGNNVGDMHRGNTGIGIGVVGPRALVEANTVMANTGNGISIQGGTLDDPNIVRGNFIGDRGLRGNGGHGLILVDGEGGGTATEEIDSNEVRGNAKSGIVVNGTVYRLRGNISGGRVNQANGECQFLVADGNLNDGGNRANGRLIPGLGGQPFPTGCLN